MLSNVLKYNPTIMSEHKKMAEIIDTEPRIRMIFDRVLQTVDSLAVEVIKAASINRKKVLNLSSSHIRSCFFIFKFLDVSASSRESGVR